MMRAARRLVTRNTLASLRRRCSTITDRFALLQTERAFDLDEKQLHRRYKVLMAETHPDRHGRSSESEKQAATDHASDLTDAYAVLKAPHTRAVHLLELHDMPLDEETGSGLLGPAFLMEIMEVREELEEVGTQQPERLRALRDANSAAMHALHGELATAFAAQDFEDARALTARLQYLQRIEEEIHASTEVT